MTSRLPDIATRLASLKRAISRRANKPKDVAYAVEWLRADNGMDQTEARAAVARMMRKPVETIKENHLRLGPAAALVIEQELRAVDAEMKRFGPLAELCKNTGRK